MIDLSIVIPAFNEAKRITPTIETVAETFRNSIFSFEIVVVNDGSSDETSTVVSNLKKQIPELRLIAYHQNEGKGYAVRQGMLLSRGRMRAMLDADGSIPASELLRLVILANSEKDDIVIGSRYVGGAKVETSQPLYRRVWSRIANGAIQAVLLKGIEDTQCGAKVFSKHAVERCFTHARINGWSFDLEVLGLAKRLGLTIGEHAITWSDDARSRVNPLKDFFNVVRETVVIRARMRRQVRHALVTG